jgi:hypothetical protein
MASQATIADAGKGGGVAPGRGCRCDLRLRGRERIMSKCCGRLGRRRERAVRQVMLRTLVTVCVRARLAARFLLIASVDRPPLGKKEATALALIDC